MVEPLALKDHTWESRIFFERIVVGFGILVVLTLFLVARFFYLQIVQYDVYATLSDKNRIQVQPLPPIRGLIYDRNGELLAENSPSFNLALTPERVEDMDETLATLRRVLQLSDEEIQAFQKRLKRRQRPFESVPLRFKLTQEEIARFSVDRHAMPGVEVEARLVRHYPKGELMVHAVGSVRRINERDARRLDPVAYSGTDHIGKIGIERFYESDLLGSVGYQQVEIDARGRVMKILESDLPSPGKDLVLHVDSSLQQAASDALGDRRGTIVAIEPETGGILAMVSKPGYDPNLFVTGIDFATYASLRDSPDVPLFNRALQGQYEPGSTIKPIIGLAGLVTGMTTADYTVDDPGWFKLPNNDRLYRDWNWTVTGLGGHGQVNLEKAIYRSCNVYFYSLAVKMGIDRIDDYLALFGFGVNTALDLPEARSGLLPTRQWKEDSRGLPWYPGDTVNIGIGQGDMLVTPLQLATAVTVVANRGKWVAPRMLKSGSDLVERSNVTRMDSIELIPDHVWDLVIGAMEKVVHRGNQVYGENGTAWAYIGQDIPYRMAGKSGTAQVVGIAQGEEYNEEELNERQRKHAWFVAFAPVEKPEIALAVLVENGGGGSSVAAPVAREIIDHHLLKNTAAKGRVVALAGQ
ncbi:MAG: penicillin-binding protein 2 [Pseudomonadales bacterium]|nr:penicillin-binding protein 2 [Pseudomonadales bacterium]MBO6597540.1 penicillin-binding protein 2 [Pseudomonadales bacterium]MBO6824410.1 penicillin-binding protein 2 [Pseudomonadales bacterium]